MMREIKFRAWNKENNTMILWWAEFFSDMSPVTNYGSEIDFDSFELMQFTGLKDKNGACIFEGDILKIGYNYINPQVVIFENGAFNIARYDIGKTEVIGNIYEHKHLIGEG